MAECLPAGEVKVLIGVASGASLSTSGLQFLGCKAAPPKAHTKGLRTFQGGFALLGTRVSQAGRKLGHWWLSSHGTTSASR